MAVTFGVVVIALVTFLVSVTDASSNRVIVKFAEGGAQNKVLDKFNIKSESIVYQFSSILNAVTLTGISDEVIEKLAADSSVESVKIDPMISVPSEADGTGEITPDDVQVEPFSWGLDRIDARSGLDGQYTYDLLGRDVDIYIVDTGINVNHDDFVGGRAANECFTTYIEEGCADFNGHGSHVAGIAAGFFSGVAKGANLFNVKVFDRNGDGFLSDVFAGLQWILDRRAGFFARNRPAVINLSISADVLILEYNEAIATLTRAGIVVTAAAGNGNGADSCTISPASAQDAITVAASNRNDTRSFFSNVGTCVDLYAPGEAIFSSDFEVNDLVVTKSGTDMACAHVAGAAALYLQANPKWTPVQVKEALIRDATQNALDDVLTSPNLLLYTGLAAAGGLPCGCRPLQVLCRIFCFLGLDE